MTTTEVFLNFTLMARMQDCVAVAVIHGTVTKTTRLSNKASIFRAELYAISLAIVLIRVVVLYYFLRHSVSSLEALNEIRVELDPVQSIIKDCTIYTHLARAETNDCLALDINPLQHPGQ